MLNADRLLETLEAEEKYGGEELLKSNNDDIDFGFVLDFCKDENTRETPCVFRCSDGILREFTFEN